MKEHHDVQARMRKIRRRLRLHKLPRPLRVAIVTLVGGTVLVAGVVMIVMPGPAFIVIPLGLFVLASEFKWAQRWAQRLVDLFDKARAKWRVRRQQRKTAGART